MLVTLPKIESLKPFFLNFYSAKRAIDSMNWKRMSPLSGTKLLPFQSAPDMELVVIKVRSVILRGVSFEITFDSWQNSVKALLETAQISPLKGLQEE